METLQHLVTELLPRLSAAEIDALLDGNATEFERALRADNAPSIDDVIEAEAKHGTARLRFADRAGLVEHDTNQPWPNVKLHERFAIEYKTSKPGHALLIQHTQQQWGVVRFASGKVSEKRLGGPILIPGQKGSEVVFMLETASKGPHRFLLFLSPRPYPSDVLRPAAAGVALEWRMLSDLARHYLAQPVQSRELHLYELMVV